MMTTAVTINTNCPHCRKAIKATREFIGKRVKCPGCQTPFTVATEDDFDPDNPFGNDVSPPPSPTSYTPPPSPLFNDLHDSYSPAQPQTTYATTTAAPKHDLPEFRSYPMLQFIRKVLLIMTILVAVCWVGLQVVSLFSLVVAFVGTSSPPPDVPGMNADMREQFASMQSGVRNASVFFAVMSALLTFFVGAIVCLCLMTLRELIAVVLHIQENTLAAARG